MNLFCRGLFRELSAEGHEVVAVSSPGSELIELKEREGVRIREVSMERRISPIRDIQSLFHLITVIRKEKPDIIHSITPKAGLLAMAAARICGVPNRIHTFTGLLFPTSKGIKRKVLRFTDSLTCRFATYVHAEGAGVRNDLIKNGITSKEITILNNGSIAGVNTDYFNPALTEVREKAREISVKDKFTFIFIGRIGAEKGINELIASFVKTTGKFPDSRLILLGWMENDLDRLSPATIKELRNNRAISYMGVKKDVRPWLYAADCLILPSYREGFPNVVLEAGAMEKPSIVTDINGANEIVVNGETGIIIPVKDKHRLEEAMETMIKNPHKARIMGKNARERVNAQFNSKDVRKALKDFYNSLEN